jgi:hypothetical protein
MRDKMVRVAATAVALVSGLSGALGGVALAGDGGQAHIGGKGGHGGDVDVDCGVSAEIPIVSPVIGKDKFAPQCDGWGGEGGWGGAAN